ncbi:dihydroorotate dehydrogenase (DUF3598) [Wolffia australiana]
MQALCVDGGYGGLQRWNFQELRQQFPRLLPVLARRGKLLLSCRGDGGRARSRGKNSGNGDLQRPRGKENVWSVDNELAEKAAEAEKPARTRRRTRAGKGPRRRGSSSSSSSSRCLVSAAMLMEVEAVLQTQEPVIIPLWNTFASSVSGIWKGVGAVFSPISGEMEPIGISNKGENLYDCYVRSRVEEIFSEGRVAEVTRKTNWVSLNSLGEIGKSSRRSGSSMSVHPKSDDFPSFESFDLAGAEVMEEDHLREQPGLVFFEDGSYSNGPAEIPVGEYDESKYFLCPTFKFEQCLVKGCHKRLRVVHTIEFSQGGADVQIIRVSVFEEQWDNAVNLDDDAVDQSARPLDVKPFSRRERTRPTDLAGAWKVFELSSTPVFDNGGSSSSSSSSGPSSLYLCMETLKKRSLPESPIHFGEEEAFDQHDVTVLWLPGGVTAYVDVLPDGVLCIGVGWYSDEGINLVMERDYGPDGKLKEVRSKTELKRRWSPDVDLV